MECLIHQWGRFHLPQCMGSNKCMVLLEWRQEWACIRLGLHRPNRIRLLELTTHKRSLRKRRK